MTTYLWLFQQISFLYNSINPDIEIVVSIHDNEKELGTKHSFLCMCSSDI